VQVRAVHRTHVREWEAYVDHLRARRDRLDAIVADGRASAESDPALARLREAAFGDRP
jgi:septum formation topological specificity factor MinE